jgi:hypothetical protein
MRSYFFLRYWRTESSLWVAGGMFQDSYIVVDNFGDGAFFDGGYGDVFDEEDFKF